MSNKRLSSWCQSILPANYKGIKKQTAQLQSFLREQLSEPIGKRVHVINITAQEIVVAVDNATIANYLRLHNRELQQQIRETFNLHQTLKFKTMPETVLQLRERPKARKPGQVSDEAAEVITNNAQWIEDENLKHALESLAKTLKKKT